MKSFKYFILSFELSLIIFNIIIKEKPVYNLLKNMEFDNTQIFCWNALATSGNSQYILACSKP